MEHKDYHLFLATPEEVIYNGRANFLMAPGALGYFEILANHASYITTLNAGKLEFVDAEHKKWELKIRGGILEVEKNHVSLLADAIEK